jgi:multidrug efflux pump subunit AcrA (membrane-fusion protein)
MRSAFTCNIRLVAAAMALACLSGPAWSQAKTTETTDARRAGMPVTVVRAVRACFPDTLQLTGIVVAREEVQVRPDAEGARIIQIVVEDGERVAAGQALARVSRSDAQPGQPTTASITTPAAGIVLHGSARVGAMASARADALFRIIVGGELELLAEIPAGRMGKLTPGQVARVDPVGMAEIRGRVRTIGSEVDGMTQLGKARIYLGSDHKVRPGMFAKATVQLGTSCGTTIPFSAVLYGPEGPVVQIIRNDRVETKRIRLSDSAVVGTSAQILEGLNVGDLAVARAGAFLREGDMVRPMEAPATVSKQ